jgi:HSP20 family protein
MANLARREHMFNELFDLRSSFDHLFNKFLNTSTATGDRQERLLIAVPPIEAWVDNEKKQYHLSVAVPGVDPKEIELNLQGNNLTVSGEHKSESEKKEADYRQQEFSYDRFMRTIALPEGVDTQKITAEFKNGVLEIVAPLSEAALPKRIEIKTPAKAKEASA